MKIPEICKRFARDFKTKEFVPLKLSYMILHGGMSFLYPFLTIHARSLGILEDELGFIYAISPIVGIAIPTLSGLVADKIGNFKLVMTVAIFASGLAGLPFMFIPYARYTHDLPQVLPVLINCTGDGAYLTPSSPYTCKYPNETLSSNLKILNCSFSCPSDGFESLDEVEIRDRGPILEISSSKQKINASTISDDSESYFKFGTPLDTSEGNINFDEIDHNVKWCQFTQNCNGTQGENLKSVADFKLNTTIFDVAFTTNYLGSEISSIEIITNGSDFCPDTQTLERLTKSRYQTEDVYESPLCVLTCNAITPKLHLCNNNQTTQIFSPASTLSMYAGLRIVQDIFTGCSFTLMESATLAILEKNNGDIGFQRFYFSVAILVLPSLTGYMIDTMSASSGYPNYSFCFIAYCLSKIIMCLVIVPLSLEFKTPSKTVFKNAKQLLGQFEIFCFVISTIVTGVSFGIVDAFLFWHLEDLGADKYLMGITVTVGAAVGLPILFFATPIIQKLGHVFTLCLGSAVFVVRLLGYAMIENPWMAMPFEALECFTVSLMGAVAASYITVLSTTDTVATMSGIFGGAHWSLGRSLGGFLGGMSIKGIGIRMTFVTFAGVCSITSIVYFLLNIFHLRKYEHERNRKKEEKKKEREEEEKNEKDDKNNFEKTENRNEKDAESARNKRKEKETRKSEDFEMSRNDESGSIRERVKPDNTRNVSKMLESDHLKEEGDKNGDKDGYVNIGFSNEKGDS